jgi:hypothetical protein
VDAYTDAAGGARELTTELTFTTLPPSLGKYGSAALVVSNTQHIGIVLTSVFFDRYLIDRTKPVHAGIVHQDIHFTVSFPRLDEKRVDFSFFRNARPDRDRLPTRLCDIFYNLIRALPARSVVHHHLRSIGSKLLRYRGANPFGRASYDRHFARQPFHCNSPLKQQSLNLASFRSQSN